METFDDQQEAHEHVPGLVTVPNGAASRRKRFETAACTADGSRS